jgi:hypothetical protein
MAVWSDSKVPKDSTRFGRPRSLWDREEIILRSRKQWQVDNGGPIRDCRSGHQNYEQYGTPFVYLLVYVPVDTPTDSAPPTVKRKCFTVAVMKSVSATAHLVMCQSDRSKERHGGKSDLVHGTDVCTSRLLNSASTAIEKFARDIHVRGNHSSFGSLRHTLVSLSRLCTSLLPVHYTATSPRSCSLRLRQPALASGHHIAKHCNIRKFFASPPLTARDSTTNRQHVCRVS